jgi:hypothetical protein
MKPDTATREFSPDLPVLVSDDVANEEIALQRELDTLTAQLRAGTQELATLETAWSDFRSRYMQTVGRRYGELEEVEALIAEALAAKGVPEEVAVEEEALPEEEPELAAAVSGATFQPLKQMRKLFWRVAKMFHPDLASDEAERERRHTLMSEANQAYQDGDAERLTSLLEDEQPAGIDPLDSATRERRALLRTQVALLRRELRAVEIEIKRITDNDFYYFKTKADEAATHGRDLLGDMEARVAEQILSARRRLEELK